jgi:hypothetical protein
MKSPSLKIQTELSSDEYALNAKFISQGIPTSPNKVSPIKQISPILESPLPIAQCAFEVQIIFLNLHNENFQPDGVVSEIGCEIPHTSLMAAVESHIESRREDRMYIDDFSKYLVKGQEENYKELQTAMKVTWNYNFTDLLANRNRSGDDFMIQVIINIFRVFINH